jgi:hypothetical protein
MKKHGITCVAALIITLHGCGHDQTPVTITEMKSPLPPGGSLLDNKEGVLCSYDGTANTLDCHNAMHPEQALASAPSTEKGKRCMETSEARVCTDIPK